MKISCRCGAVLVDGTDDLPHKAHLIPDQDWTRTLDALDATIERAAQARIDANTACMQARKDLTEPRRILWQCRTCGRLYIEGRDRQLHGFAPESASVDRELFRTHRS